MRQSERLPVYTRALRKLWDGGLLYPCTCTRRDIETALAAPQEGSLQSYGPDGVIYPGTCRTKTPKNAEFPQNNLLRLSTAKALETLRAENNLNFTETGHGPNGETGDIKIHAKDYLNYIGDIVLARRDMSTSYHLSVVLDDAAQGVNHVFRGADLFDATKIHVLLQRLLGLPTPIFHHHKLIRDDNGKRLAKRDDARAIAKYRTEGASPNDIRTLINLPSSL